MRNLERINELTNEVNRFLKQKSERLDNGSYKVDKELFLEVLFQIEHIYTDDTIKSSFNFLNARINKKYYQIVRQMDDLSNEENIYSDISLKIIEELQDQDTLIINFDNYTNERDDISRIVFRIDKDIPHNILLDNDKVYNSRKAEDEESKKYFSKYGNVLWLDDELDGTEELSHSDLISNDNVISQVSNSEEQLEQVNMLIESMGLTNRQKEILKTLSYCDYNQSTAANELGIDVSNVNKALRRIRDKFDTKYEEDKTDVLDEFNSLINTTNNYYEIADFIKHNLNNATIDNLVHSVDFDNRKHFFRYIRQQEYNANKLNQFITNLIIAYNK